MHAGLASHSYQDGRYFSYHGWPRTLSALTQFLKKDAAKLERLNVLPNRVPYWYSLQIAWYNAVLAWMVRTSRAHCCLGDVEGGGDARRN